MQGGRTDREEGEREVCDYMASCDSIHLVLATTKAPLLPGIYPGEAFAKARRRCDADATKRLHRQFARLWDDDR